MNKAEAQAVSEAILLIERGKTREGVQLLRAMMSAAGLSVPALRVAARQPEPPGKEP